MGKKGVLTPGQQRLAFPPTPTPADSQSAESKRQAKTKQSSGKASAVAKAQAGVGAQGKAAKVKAKAKAKALAAKAKAKAKAAKQAEGPAQAKAKRQEQAAKLEANATSAKKAEKEPTALDGTTDDGREAGALAKEPKLAAAPALPKETGPGEACNPEPSKMEEVPVAAAVVIHNEAQDARSRITVSKVGQMLSRCRLPARCASFQFQGFRS